MNISLDDYKILILRDSSDFDVSYGAVMLNIKKHTIEEFQNTIYNARIKYEKEIEENGNDWEYIKEELVNFDYFEIDLDIVADSIYF